MLLGNQTFLTAALNIHSVEARHASAIRYLRRSQGVTTNKPWITLGAGGVANDTGNSKVDGNYASENNTVQGGVTITNLTGATSGTITAAAAAEAFDEPLDTNAVVTLVTPFGVKFS